MAKVPVYADGNGSYKVEDYWDRIESEGLIADKDADKIDNGDGTYEITTTPGYVFEITVEPDEEIADNIIIGECIGKGENLNIGLRVVNKTTNSIEIEVVRAEGTSDFKYSIKKQGEEYGEAQASESTTYTFNGLTQGGIYTIKVEATKDGEQQEVERTVQVGEIPRAIYGEVRWGDNGQAQVRIYTEENGYQLEWQKNGIAEGSWTRESTGIKEVTIPNLVNGDIIYARLYDGVSSGDYANIETTDNKIPEITRFEAIDIKGTSVSVEVEATDKESGLVTSGTYEYYVGEELKATIEEASYTFTDLQASTSYKLKVIVKDKVGNKNEKTIDVETTKATAEEILKEGKYVEYLDKTGVTRKCTVLYDNTAEYGTQIITMDTVGDVELGGLIDQTALNNKANDYNNETYSSKARIVGSNPSSFKPGTEDAYSNNKIIDRQKILELGINNIGKEYWLASGYKSADYKYYFTVVRYITNTGGFTSFKINENTAANGYKKFYKTSGLRPVFLLNSNVIVIGGDGTEENPYKLGVE